MTSKVLSIMNIVFPVLTILILATFLGRVSYARYKRDRDWHEPQLV